MGVYDFFKGRCPGCSQNLDHHPEWGRCGDIQTKFFLPEPEPGLCFRQFFPGDRVPFPPGKNFIIGRTCCCETVIKACFHHDILTEYVVACGIEKRHHLQREGASPHASWTAIQDGYWLLHHRHVEDTGLLEEIIKAALHPKRISHYFAKGYSIDDICS